MKVQIRYYTEDKPNSVILNFTKSFRGIIKHIMNKGVVYELESDKCIYIPSNQIISIEEV